MLTRLEAEQLGIQAVETELQYSTRADLVLTVPPDLNLEGTMFDFFQTVNVLEFKGQSDQLTLREYVRNDLRTDLALLQSKDDDFNNILNVIVTSRSPQTFFEQAEKWGIFFQPEKEKPGSEKPR